MKLGYYQIFWEGEMNTFEYRYSIEVVTLINEGIIKHATLIHWVNDKIDEIPQFEGTLQALDKLTIIAPQR